MLVFDSEQNIIDTLYRKNYEHVEDMIESSKIASYGNSKKVETPALIMSLNKKLSGLLHKSPSFESDTIIRSIILEQLNISQQYTFVFESLVLERDTICYLSYSDYSKNETKVLLIKNSMVVDSIDQEYIISKMASVPLSTKRNLLYLASCSIPDTDALWNSLIGIDLVETKFKLYRGNRIGLKNNQIQY